MDHQSIARVLLALFCALQGIATAAIDLGRTHARHPDWLGHARFHVVWQTASVLVLTVIELVLVSMNGPFTAYRFAIAAALAAVPMLGFFLALFTRRLFGATLSDPGGMPPFVVGASGRQFHIDLNVVAEIVGLVCLAAIVKLYRAP